VTIAPGVIGDMSGHPSGCLCCVPSLDCMLAM
jgi:hypothetical protein